jgi:hypothetical protein
MKPKPGKAGHPGHGKGKVFDVVRPGKALAPPTSRPVIVGHKPAAKRAQMAVSGVGEKPPAPKPKQKIEIRPVAEPQPEAAQPQTPAIAETPQSPSVQQPATAVPPSAVLLDSAAPEAPVTPENAAPIQPLSVAPSEASAAPPQPQPTTLPEEAWEDIAPSFEHDRPEIVVSHHSSHGAWLTIILWLFIILLALAALNIAVDSSLLKWNGIPHTNFF